MAAFGTRRRAQSTGLALCRNSSDVDWAVAPSLFPNQQEFVDQHVCVIYSWLGDVAACCVLLGCRSARLARMGQTVSRVWQECDSGVCARGASRRDQHRFRVPRFLWLSVDAAWLVLRPLFHSIREPNECIARFRSVLCGADTRASAAVLSMENVYPHLNYGLAAAFMGVLPYRSGS